ncbi:hypothetical protein GP486_005589 [Trichoglossum hirsutum]|uniref:Uncharacterized protein n=1 Tax=Trichoglossum hirsutum TaxID=265104 RepID=A0A9P8L8X3_9PEZI|nr:hypothetical protein GP486_005589 [Trichoglossum hirsutum]
MALPPASNVFVGVDIGMTCTGVAFYVLDQIESGQPITPVIIQEWPGTGSRTITNKVPTTLAYKAGYGRPRSWGFECPSFENLGGGIGIIELFKFWLDPEVLRAHITAESKDAPEDIDVKKWFTDFLSALHKHIVAHLELPYWRVSRHSTKIEYIFGLPTMWGGRKEPIDDFKEIVKNAGFITSENCSVTFRLTEAEASAVYTAKSLKRKYKKGDTIIVCDAGGGTTDICALQVEHMEGEVINLLLLDEPTVLYVGSVQIDEAFKKHAEKCLNNIRLRKLIPELPEYVTHTMAKGTEFQTMKINYPEYSYPVARIPVPTTEARVDVTPDELKTMFDEQIGEILKHIDQRVLSLRQNKPELKSLFGSYTSFSLVALVPPGMSKQRLGNIIGTKAFQYYFLPIRRNCTFPAPFLILANRSHSPLAVCKGLVIDSTQRLCNGISAIPIRPYWVSYGILCSEPYDKNMPAEQRYATSRLDGEKYAINRIHWFIRYGEAAKEDEPIICKYFRMVSADDQRETWRSKVVKSSRPSNLLPEFLGQDGAEVISQIVSDSELSPDVTGTTTKRRYGLGKKREIKEYEILVFIEGTGPRFVSRVDGVERNLKTERVTSRGGRSVGDEEDSFQDGFFRNLL